MNTKNMFSWLLFFLGEVIIIIVFILFKGDTETNTLALNIIISTVIYSLFFRDLLISWIDRNDSSHIQVGSIGLRWLVTWVYATLSITTMILSGAILSLPFSTQVLIHIVLIFFALLGFLGASRASGQVKKVYIEESFNRDGIVNMRTAISELKDKLTESADFPASFINKVNSLEENLRYLAPTNSSEADALEKSFIETINDIRFSLSNYSLNEAHIESNLKKTEYIFQKRKQIYSK